MNRAHESPPLEMPLCRWEDKVVKLPLKSEGKNFRSRSARWPDPWPQRGGTGLSWPVFIRLGARPPWLGGAPLGTARGLLLLAWGTFSFYSEDREEPAQCLSRWAKTAQTFHVICCRISQMFPCRNLKQNTKCFNITYKAGPEPNLYDVILCLPMVLHVPVKSASCFGY